MKLKLNIGIIDNSNSPLSNSLKDYLESKNNIIDVSPEEEIIRGADFLQIVDAVVVIPEEFEEGSKQGKVIEVYRDDRKAESIQIEHQIEKFLLFANATMRKEI